MAPLLLRNASLIDGTGRREVRDAAVLIADGRVTWAGAAGQLPPAASTATTVDLGGHTICPGFFDCHVHLGLPGASGNPYQRALTTEAYHALQLVGRLQVTLENGVTTARDLMGVDAGVRQAVADGLVAGPRLLVAIDMLSQTAGHADFHLPSGIDLTPLAHGSLVDSVDAARRRARELISLGADLIKVASSGGVSSPNDRPDWLGMRADLVAAVVEECRAYGEKPVAAHAIGYAGIKAALEGGVTSIEHGYALDDELRRRMVDQGTYLVPTLLETMADVASSPGAQQQSTRWHAIAQEAVGRSAAAGVKIALGTDAGLTPAHGTNLAELGLLVRFGGLTPMEAIVAGTKTSAELCGLSEELGTIEQGKLADVVVVRGDPIADIDSVGDPANILLVLKEGRAVSDRGGFFDSARDA